MNSYAAYYIVNLTFFILLSLLMVFVLSMPVHELSPPCMVKAFTGSSCPSCGFTTAFLDWMNGKRSFQSLEPGIITVILFLLLQWLLRLTAIMWLNGSRLRPALIRADIGVSISLFLLAFLPLSIQ